MRIIIQLHLILLLILASSSAQLSFAQRLGGSVSFKSNELGPAFFIQDNDSVSRYHFQVDFLTFTVVHRDQYNNDATSVSMFPLIRLVPELLYVLCNIGAPDEGFHGILPDSSALRNVVIGIAMPFLLATSQIHMALIPYPINLRQATGFRSSLFVGMQTDYFIGDQANWFRYSPCVGIEFGNVFTHNDNWGNPKQGPAIAIQFGVARRFDFSSAFSPRADNTAFVAVKMGPP